MKRIFFFFFLFGTFPFVNAQQFPANRHLKALLDSGDYFQFSSEFLSQMPEAPEDHQFAVFEPENAYFESWDFFLFDKPERSNSMIEYFLTQKRYSYSDSIAAELLQLHFQNDLRLFHYKIADSVCNVLLFRYASVISQENLAGIKNSGEVTAALKNTPPQTIERNGDLDIKFKRDIASLIRIPITMNDKNANFIMDTGANLSTLSESEAKKMGVKILDANFGVTSSSRSSVNSKLGVADKIVIGNATFRNVVFLILPDKSLSFLGGLYKIKGIIGLPVIAQLGEVQIKKDNHIFSPIKQTESNLANFGMNGNTPFANVNFYGAWHPYIFDTGAATSILGSNFNSTYSDSLKNFEKSTSNVGGAGGVQKISTLKVTNLHYNFGNQNGLMKRATVQLSGNEEVFGTFYGIVGEDIFMQWDTVIINFDRMFVLFK